MQKVYKAIILILSVIFLSVFIISCASSNGGARGREAQVSQEEQTEQDILKLLGVEGEVDEEYEVGEKPLTDLGKRVTELEKQLIEKNSEINELKSEIILKNERIDELQSKVGEMRISFPQVREKIDFNEFSRRYQIALNGYYSKKYREAIKMFDELLSIDMNNSLSDNCQYWIGECYYALRDFKKAVIEFEKVFTFSNSNKDDDAQLKLGLCYINLRDKERARSELNRLLTNYPNSEYVQKAKSFLDNL